MLAIFKKEVKSYFYSPVAYVLIGLFVLAASILFLQNLGVDVSGSANGDYNGNFFSMILILIFIVPILTMRLLSEDRKNGTEVLLITSPSGLTNIVVGKYLAALLVFLVLTIASLIYPILLLSFGAPFTIKLVGGYLGFVLLGAAFIVIGLFASSLTENQVVAAVISFVSLFGMFFIDWIAGLIGGIPAKILGWFSLISRFDNFSKGLLSLSELIYYLSFIGVFLFLTVRVIEKRRWS